jgi:hypothetical protein
MNALVKDFLPNASSEVQAVLNCPRNTGVRFPILER